MDSWKVITKRTCNGWPDIENHLTFLLAWGSVEEICCYKKDENEPKFLWTNIRFGYRSPSHATHYMVIDWKLPERK